ncbi:arsenic resistance protein [Edwardsiella tarda]|uniref:arsenic resistance protein n=1 Tax=Edwardsiella tarda TaxID=636 RepID=UPI00266F6F20|nr:arsenic resistance protein [Edwardsiella tarda]WKS82040.1 arsenic resistance protein [Edwardsiella tarda]
MSLSREWLERRQIALYLAAILLAILQGLTLPTYTPSSQAISLALALMLYATFLQLPLGELGRALRHPRFLAALLLTQFLVIPLLLTLLLPLLPDEPLLRLGILLVLLTPCIDYVVPFAQLGRADVRPLLAATPLLLMLQMVLLPLYLHLFLGAQAAQHIQPAPFITAFLQLVVLPLCLAALTQTLCRRSRRGQAIAHGLALLPVPSCALVLWVVVASTFTHLEAAADAALQSMPIYLLFAAVAPLIGWGMARLWRLDAPQGRAIAFSAATRNSLVVLPLALAIPGALPLLPAVIVSQTLVELLSELVYIRLIARLGRRAGVDD